jgi:hypothetical protein
MEKNNKKHPKDANGHVDKKTGKITYANPPRLNEMRPDYYKKLKQTLTDKEIAESFVFPPTEKERKEDLKAFQERRKMKSKKIKK